MKALDPMKGWYSAQELAGLPGMPGTDSAVMRLAKKNLWADRRKLRGKGVEYALRSLPEITRLAIADAAAVVVVPAHEAAPVVVAEAKLPMMTVAQPLKTEQIDAEVARDRIAKFVADFDGPAPRAIDYLNAGFHAQTLSGAMAWAMEHAWEKRRADARLTLSTLNKWKSVKKARGRSAPLKRQKDMAVKPWHALAIALKQRPQGSCTKWIAEQIEENWKPQWGTELPGYHVVRRFFTEKYSQVDQLKGRLTGSALAPHKHYTERTSAGMLPWQEIHADGWNTHFTAPHPVTGEYVTYEVWHAHDVATRYVPPFGIGLTENFEVIAKCVENAIRDGGCMAILQTDSTKIVKDSERFKTNPATALADRVGFTVVHPVKVGNSQANGIAENFNTWLDKESRELATYQAKGMDSLTLKRVKKLTAKAVRAHKAGDHDGYSLALQEAERMGKGRVFKSHQEACAWLEEKRQKWNDKPHQRLGKCRDPETGRMRHMSPNEALLEARNNGWSPVLFPEEYLVTMFRPHVQVKVRREAVSPYGGMRYHHECLGDWNGKDVVVAYDIMDWRQVWVKTLQGELICTADFSEATGYRTQTAYEAAEEKRAQAQIRHRERQIDAIRERAGMDSTSIEGEATRVVEVPLITDEEMEALELAMKQPKPKSLMEVAMWLYEDEIEAGMKPEGSEGTPNKESAAG